MNQQRNQIIAKAIIDVLGADVGIYSASDILTVANIDNQNLEKLLQTFQNSVADITKEL